MGQCREQIRSMPSRGQDVRRSMPSREQEVRRPMSIQEQEIRRPESSLENEGKRPEATQEQDIRRPLSSREQEIRRSTSSRKQDIRRPLSIREQELRSSTSGQEQEIRRPISSQETRGSIASLEQEIRRPLSSREHEIRRPTLCRVEEIRTPISSREQEIRRPTFSRVEEIGTPISSQEQEIRRPQQELIVGKEQVLVQGLSNETTESEVWMTLSLQCGGGPRPSLVQVKPTGPGAPLQAWLTFRTPSQADSFLQEHSGPFLAGWIEPPVRLSTKQSAPRVSHTREEPLKVEPPKKATISVKNNVFLMGPTEADLKLVLKSVKSVPAPETSPAAAKLESKSLVEKENDVTPAEPSRRLEPLLVDVEEREGVLVRIRVFRVSHNKIQDFYGRAPDILVEVSCSCYVWLMFLNFLNSWYISLVFSCSFN